MARRGLRGSALAALACGAILVATSGAAVAQRRAYELVMPPDARVQADSTALNFAANASGAAWKVASHGGAALYSTTASLNLGDEFGGTDLYLARRDNRGWRTGYVGPPGSWNIFPAGTTAPEINETTPQLALGIAANQAHPPMSPDPIEPTIAYVVRSASGTLNWLAEDSGIDPASGLAPIGLSDDGTVAAFRVAPRPGTPGSPAIHARTPAGLRLVSVDQDGRPVAASPPGGRVTDRAVSSDGRRIFIFGSDASGEHLYVRIDGERTVKVVDSPAASPVKLEGISTDGAWALLSTAAPITSDDTDDRIDLYRAGISAAGSVTLERLSRGDAPSSGNDSTCGASSVPCDAASVGFSASGAAVYFGSPEALTPDAAAGANNLYVRRAGRTTLVAPVDAIDRVELWELPSRALRIYGMTADGSRFAFVSKAPLKPGYDNAGHTEIYVYDDASRSLVCASCTPSGAPPTGDLSLEANSGDGSLLTADGRRVFFTSPDRLVAGDINNSLDVYEADVERGTLALVSSGHSSERSLFYSASADGRDVMFLTFEVLVPQDRNGDGFLKLYDAREDGGFPFDPPHAPCDGAECQPSSPPGPPPAVPTTSAFAGRGNVPTVVDESEHRISPSALSRAELARAARTGVLRVAVRGLLAPTRLTVSATARVQGRRVGVGRATRSVRSGTSATIRLSLSRSARRELRRRKRLVLQVTVLASSPRSTVTVSGILRAARPSRGTGRGR